MASLAQQRSYRNRPIEVTQQLSIVRDPNAIAEDQIVSREVSHAHKQLDKENEEVLTKENEKTKQQEAKKAFLWLKDNQLPDGSWYAEYLNSIPMTQRKETNFSAYIGTGLWHYYLIFKDKDFIDWSKNWEKRILINGGSKENSLELMKKNNPIVIPRNHKVEEVLEAANNNDLKPMYELLSILKKPYTKQINIEKFQTPSNNQNYQTFCGT